MRILKVNCLFNTEETAAAERMAVPVPVSAYDLKTVYFTRVDFWGPYEIEGKLYTKFGSGGESFICPFTPAEFEAKLKRAFGD